MKRLALVAFALLLEPVVTSGQAADALLARVKQERARISKRCRSWCRSSPAVVTSMG